MEPKLMSDEQLATARSLFPFLATGRVYLNHAATSPLSSRVVGAMHRHLEGRSAGTIDTFANDLAMITSLRASVARLIHAASPDRIAFSLNTSDALNVVTTGIDWRPGDRIILNRAEFPANVYPYAAARRAGAEIDWLDAPQGVVTPERLEDAMTPRTRVVALSAVQFLSGYKADLAAIGALCRSRGILFIVDGIQGVGATPIDVQQMRIDAMSAGAQKWQMSPLGTGFLYVAHELQERLEPQYQGWLGVNEPWDFFQYFQPLHPTAKRYEGGTMNIPGLWGMSAAVETLLETGIDTIAGHLLALTDQFIRGIDRFSRCSIITPREHERRAGIVTIQPAPEIDAKSIFQSLADRRIDISLRDGALRVSPHFYNTPLEIAALLHALEEHLG